MLGIPLGASDLPPADLSKVMQEGELIQLLDRLFIIWLDSCHEAGRKDSKKPIHFVVEI